MGFIKRHNKRISKKSAEGIKADYYLEKVHFDFTYNYLPNDIMIPMLLIQDNFSRKILAAQICQSYNSAFVANALQKVIIASKLNDLHTELICDGGSENSGEVNIMLQQYTNISKNIAQKDTPRANNIVEALHKKFKNEIVAATPLHTYAQLEKQLPAMIDQYNNMPHNSLYGHTPNQIAAGILMNPKRFETQIANAQTQRLIANKKTACCKI
jgi:putative transposase